MQSDGGQYIDLDYVPNGSGVEIGGELTLLGYANTSSWVYIFGAYTNESSVSYRLIRSGATNNYVLAFNNSKASGGGTSIPISLNQKYSFKFTDDNLIFGDNTYNNSLKSADANSGSLYLFGHSIQGAICKFHSFYVKKDGVMIRDLMPVESNGVGYMYDKVSGTLFGNNGSGSFILPS